MVRNLLLIFTIVSSMAFHAQALTAQQKHDVLLTLNNICGDVWCEGPFDINFLDLYTANQTESFILQAATTADPGDPMTEQSIHFRCELLPLTIFNLVNAKDEESYFNAEVELFSKVSDCIDTALYSRIKR